MRALVWALRDGQLAHVGTVAEDGHAEGQLARDLERWVEHSGKRGTDMLEYLAERWTTGYTAVQLTEGDPITKADRTYIAPGEKPPEGVSVQRGKRGGRYYEGKRPEPKEAFEFSPNEPRERVAPHLEPTVGDLINNPGWRANTYDIKTHGELFAYLGVDERLGRYAKLVKTAWAQLPIEHFRGVSEVRGGKSRPDALAEYDRSDRSVSLYFTNSPCATRYKQQGIVHEVGHAVFDGLWRPPGGPAMHGYPHSTSDYLASQLRRRVHESYFVAFNKAANVVLRAEIFGTITPEMIKLARDVGAVSVYALKDVNEFFAEGYAAYVQQSALLEKTNPDLYDIMKRLFGGKEYK
jgi:hypothetical protein